MTKHIPANGFKPSHAPHTTEPEPSPTWAWDDDDIEPHTARAAAGYITGRKCLFRAFAVINGLPIYLGIYIGKADACRAIVEAHGAD